MTTAALVDDHPVFRQGLKLLFELHGDPRVVGEAGSPRDACEMVAATRPDVILLDLILADGANGISVALELLQRNPAERILFVSMVKDEARVAHALEAGALGYATKDQSWQDLVDAVRAVASGRPYLGSTLRLDKVEEQRRALQESARLGGIAFLTVREREIFDLTVGGLTSAAVGEKLGLSCRTVESHRARILARLGVRSTIEMVRLAALAGVL